MRNTGKITAVLLGFVLALSIGGPAQADEASYYNKQPRLVAKDADCVKSFEDSGKPEEGEQDYYLKGTCKVGKVGLTLITFKGPGQQAEWKAYAIYFVKTYFPSGTYFFALDKGAAIGNKNFTRKSAVIAKRRLNATIVRVQVN